MAKDLRALYHTSKEAELEGNWFELDEETGFKVKRLGGRNHAKYLQLIAKEHKKYIGQDISEDKEKEILVRIFCQGCLTDWKGVVLDGKELKYNEENAVKLFTELPELYDMVVQFASNIDNYREQLGNSSPASSKNSSPGKTKTKQLAQDTTPDL